MRVDTKFGHQIQGNNLPTQSRICGGLIAHLLFAEMSGYPEAELAYCVAAITNNITTSGIELRGLKLESVFLRPAREISGFHNLRPHDLRHLAITRMLENGVDGELVNAISGHVSQRMREYYSHQRTRVRYKAVQAIKPEYDVRKMTDEGRQCLRKERVKAKARPKLESMA